MITAGLDIDGPISKVDLLKDGKIVGRSSTSNWFSASRAVEDALEEVMRQAGLSLDDVDAAIATVLVRRQACFSNDQVVMACMATLNLGLQSGPASRSWTLRKAYFHYAILGEGQNLPRGSRR